LRVEFAVARAMILLGTTLVYVHELGRLAKPAEDKMAYREDA
jgi:hypothetical protein